MKIKAPVNSLEAAKIFAKMGVEEVYVGVKGLKEHDMRVVTFNGRFQSTENVDVSLKDFDELSEIVDFCHKNNMKVSFTANSRYLSQNLNDYYLEYVKKALKCNVDAVIVGSIGGLMLLKDMNLEVPVYSSTYFYPFNKYCIDFFNKMNVKRVVLPTALSLKEIKDMKDYIQSKKYDIELEVFAQFGCSNISGRCNIPNLPSPHKGYPLLCRGLYDVTDMRSGKKTELYPFMNASNDCSICVLDSLVNSGVESLKILGREKPIDFIASITYIYKNALKKLEEGVSIDEIREDILNKAPWWKNVFCKKQHCLYSDIENSKYNV